jgi:hypothetical protein
MYDKHPNKHLQNAWNKFGKDAFNFEIIEECKEDDLLDRESLWMKNLNVFDYTQMFN